MPWRHPSGRRPRRSTFGGSAPSTTRRPGNCSASSPTRASQAVRTPCCCWSTRRCTPRAAARCREERPVDDTPVVDTDRGGKITWHGPGQLVGYPIIGLAEPLDVVNFVRRLEESMIKVCAGLGLETGRVEGRSGVWVPCRRAASGAQDRRHRHPGVARDDAARLRAQLRLRPGRFLGDRAVRHLRCRRDLADRRTRPPRSVSTTCMAPVADAVCDALDGRLVVALTQ